MGQLLDITECAVRALLLLYLCSDMISLKKRFRRQGRYLFFLFFVIWGFWLSNSGWLNRLLYGERMAVQKSSTSLIKVILMMIVLFLLLDFFYEGKKLMKVYLTLLYETILELAKFGVHGLWTLLLNAYNDWQINRMMDDVSALETYMGRMRIMGYVWNLLLMVLYLFAAYITIRAVLKYRRGIQNIDRQGILFLMLFPAVGMAFDVMLRCLFFTGNGAGYDFIYDKHVGMYAIIPLMNFLCLLSIVYSTKIYKELMYAEVEKNRMLFYKQQLSDMTEHVQDMERLYDGIRSMRHDMNNCIADMEQLFYADKGAEAGKYLYRMKNALDALTFRYNTGNPVTDVVMNRKWRECENAGIEFASEFIYPGHLGIEAFDLGILLNNALDNAIEACRKCDGSNMPYIRVRSYQKGRMFFIHMENDCDGRVFLRQQNEIAQQDKMSSTILPTSKPDKWMHGVGMQNMRSVVEQYFGTMSYEIRDDVFILTVMMQGRTHEKGGKDGK